MPAVAGGILSSLAGSPAASAIAGLPTTAAPALTSTGIPALGLTGTGAGAAGVGSAGAIGVLGTAALGGGFLVGDNVVRPLLGIEYPGGGGFNDYRNRRTGGREALMNQAAQPIPISPGSGQGGQVPGVQYRVTATADIQGSQFNGTREALVYGPVRSVSPQFCRGSLGSISWGLVIQASDAAGNPGTFYGGPCTVWTGDSPIGDAKQISTGPTIERADGEPDIDPRPGRNRPPGLVSPPVLNPTSNPPTTAPRTPPRPATPSAPPNSTPAVPPTPSPEPVEPDTDRPPYPSWLPPALAGLGLAGLAGLAGRTRGNPGPSVPPLSQPAPRVPPTPPTPPTPTNNCGCNPGIQRAIDNSLRQNIPGLMAEGASTASILAKLNQIQNFAEQAWKTTRLQKVLDALTLITVLHNASMVSRDVAETLGYVVSNGLAIIGIDDEEGNPLNVNEIVGDALNGFIVGILGQDVYDDIRETYTKANRIVQSASMIVWTIRSIHDGSQEVMEWIGENTGRIGNALKRWGVVGFNAYPWMQERMQAQDAVRRRYRRILDGLETAEDTASSYAMVTGEIREVQQEISELGEQRQRFRDSIADFTPNTQDDNVPIQTAANEAVNASESPEVQLVDTDRASPDATP
ncbi:MAG: hypothetical protein AAF215_31565 [Cyanobacteria bacterium P01_A01_bin.123]